MYIYIYIYLTMERYFSSTKFFSLLQDGCGPITATSNVCCR